MYLFGPDYEPLKRGSGGRSLRANRPFDLLVFASIVGPKRRTFGFWVLRTPPKIVVFLLVSPENQPKTLGQLKQMTEPTGQLISSGILLFQQSANPPPPRKWVFIMGEESGESHLGTLEDDPATQKTNHHCLHLLKNMCLFSPVGFRRHLELNIWFHFSPGCFTSVNGRGRKNDLQAAGPKLPAAAPGHGSASDPMSLQLPKSIF